jgi:hypothetical protein
VDGDWWHGYEHPSCHFDTLYEAALDAAMERPVTAVLSGREAAWDRIVARLDRR